MKTAIYKIGDLSCPSCVKGIEKAFKRLNGVAEVRVLFNSSKVKISFQEDVGSPKEFSELLQNLGYPVVQEKIG
ncbi:heavy-metal-associated domain-containing protein [Cytobacillus sp. Hz8]|uniref:heavy-metal-associated domain-containing protein n=1 Tax=Cytobacillus sp. Hz8 TaxID=3347168 RepID=UPI0035E15ACB